MVPGIVTPKMASIIMSGQHQGDDSAVNESYTRLEDVIRNFSREINSYVENINYLNRQLEMAEEELGSKNEALKNLTIERDRLKQVREDDDKSRFAVEAL